MPKPSNRRPSRGPLALRRQLSLFVPVAEYRVLRDEANRRRIPVAHLLRQMLEPDYSRLMAAHSD